MKLDANRWGCDECGCICKGEELLQAPNPFDTTQMIHGCPNCHAVDSMHDVCDEPGCKLSASSGFPEGDVYRRTCHGHSKWARDRIARELGPKSDKG